MPFFSNSYNIFIFDTSKQLSSEESGFTRSIQPAPIATPLFLKSAIRSNFEQNKYWYFYLKLVSLPKLGISTKIVEVMRVENQAKNTECGFESADG